MRKAGILLATFVLAFAIGVVWSSFTAETLEAKPNICVLAVTPFLVCEPSNRCHDGEQYCWECQGRDPAGNPCLCRRVGCM
jgi:hypothetical protein